MTFKIQSDLIVAPAVCTNQMEAMHGGDAIEPENFDA
jgi:hypothetical protein